MATEKMRAVVFLKMEQSLIIGMRYINLDYYGGEDTHNRNITRNGQKQGNRTITCFDVHRFHQTQSFPTLQRQNRVHL